MRNFSFENKKYRDILDSQVIHMDQAVCYNPEYIATRKMHHYPSRIAQIIRAVYLEQLPPSSYGADIIFSSILSGLGERWQNFGEEPCHYLWAMFLGREVFVKKGFQKQDISLFNNRRWLKNSSLETYLDNDLPTFVSSSIKQVWMNIPLENTSSTGLFLDDLTMVNVPHSVPKLISFFTNHHIQIRSVFPCFTGIEYFAMGYIEEGTSYLQNLISSLSQQGIRKLITLSGQGHFVLTYLCKELGIEHDIEIVNILEIAQEIECSKAYIYGGSFYTRYLKMASLLEKLTANSYQTMTSNSTEFNPIYKADTRVHKISHWNPPLRSEYFLYDVLTELEENIFQYACTQISKSACKQLVICDPLVYTELRKRKFNKCEIIYYLDALI